MLGGLGRKALDKRFSSLWRGIVGDRAPCADNEEITRQDARKCRVANHSAGAKDDKSLVVGVGRVAAHGALIALKPSAVANGCVAGQRAVVGLKSVAAVGS